MARCWRPDCRRDAPHTLAGHDWVLRACDRDLAVARSVTGIGLGRRRADGDALFEMPGGGAK